MTLIEELRSQMHRAVDELPVRDRLAEIRGSRSRWLPPSFVAVCAAAVIGVAMLAAALLMTWQSSAVTVRTGSEPDGGRTNSISSSATTTSAPVATSVTAPGDTQGIDDPKPEPSAVPLGPQAPKGSVPSFPATTVPNYEYGIVAPDDVDPELGKTLDVVSNGYGGLFAGVYYYVIAGGSLDGPSDGELYILTSSTTVEGPPSASRHTLAGHGALTIQSATLPAIVVQTADGGTYTFSLVTGTFTP